MKWYHIVGIIAVFVFFQFSVLSFAYNYGQISATIECINQDLDQLSKNIDERQKTLDKANEIIDELNKIGVPK